MDPEDIGPAILAIVLFFAVLAWVLLHVDCSLRGGSLVRPGFFSSPRCVKVMELDK